MTSDELAAAADMGQFEIRVKLAEFSMKGEKVVQLPIRHCASYPPRICTSVHLLDFSSLLLCVFVVLLLCVFVVLLSVSL
jgi:hypothetical protein